MICEVYLLVSLYGRNVRRWIVVAGDEPLPRVFRNKEVALRIADILARDSRNWTKDDIKDETPQSFLRFAEEHLVREIKRLLPIALGHCPEGKLTLATGYKACIDCTHLKRDKTSEEMRWWPWICGVVIREVMVARALADR